MDFKITVVINVAQLPKLIHKVAHAGTRRADHVRERLLTDFGDDRLLLSVLAEVRQQEQRPRQPLFAGIEQLVDQVFLHSDRASQKMRREPFGKIRLLAEDARHGGLIHSADDGILQGPGGRNAPRPSGEATLADKISGFEECDDCFLTLRRDNGDFDPPFSNVEDGIRRLTLGEDGLTLGVFRYGESAIRLGEKRLRVEFGF